MDRSLRREWHSFKGSVRGYVALWGIMSLGLVVWRLTAGDPLGEAAVVGAGGLLVGVLVTPLMWVRYDRRHRGGLRNDLKAIGLSVLWLAAGVLVLVVVLASTGDL